MQTLIAKSGGEIVRIYSLVCFSNNCRKHVFLMLLLWNCYWKHKINYKWLTRAIYRRYTILLTSQQTWVAYGIAIVTKTNQEQSPVSNYSRKALNLVHCTSKLAPVDSKWLHCLSLLMLVNTEYLKNMISTIC